MVDDLPVRLAQPRDEEVRAQPEALAITKTVLRHLGLARPGRPAAAA